MPTINANYEALLVFSVKNGEEATKAMVEKFKVLVETNAATTEVDEWGKRRLAYLIGKEAEGYYALYNFTSEPDFPAELERVCKITDGVLRSLVIKKETN